MNSALSGAVVWTSLMSLHCLAAGPVPEISIVTDKVAGDPASYALEKLADVLREKNISFEKVFSEKEAHGKSLIIAGLGSGNGAAARILKAGKHSLPQAAEALTIWKTNVMNRSAWVIGGYDDRGLMYGLLDVAERIGWSMGNGSPMDEVREITETPAVGERAISIFTMNRAYWESRFYNEAYWTGYLDMLAKNRFNSLVVIFGYENGGFLAPPYPYFFNVEAYPDVRMVGLTHEQQERNLAALNHLIAMAHQRGIRFTVGIWDHIYRGGVQGGGIPGTQKAPDQPVAGLIWGVTSDNLIGYNKTALAKFVRLVPALDGIQFRMHNESGLQAGEQDAFWLDVFRMMKKTAPKLRCDLRAKELPTSVIESALSVGLNFRITTKYWMEQMGMPYHPTKTNPEKSPIRHSYAYLLRYPKKYNMHWRLWNGGTARVLLWGDPGYVRRFAESTHLYDGDGFEVNEPLATKMEAQPHDAVPFQLLNEKYRYYDWEFERYWHFFQVFGRVGYNPETAPDVWSKEFENHFGSKAGPFLEEALHKASWILPRIIASVYPYRSFPMTRGWAEKQRLGDLPAYANNEGSDIMQFANFDEEAAILTGGGETPKIRPSENSQWFQNVSDEVKRLVAQAEKVTDSRSREFISTITDLKILSSLALYHARRIPAAVSYRLFQRTKNVSALEDAIAHERNAIEAWTQLVNAAGDVYSDNLMMGVCVADLCGHWKDELASLQKGLESLEQERKTFAGETAALKAAPLSSSRAASTDKSKIDITLHPVISASVGKPIAITVKATAPAGIKWVHLRYRSVNQDPDYQTLPMLKDARNDEYQATVPVDQIDPEYDLMYFIEVMDNSGRGTIYPDLNKETPYRFIKLIR